MFGKFILFSLSLRSVLSVKDCLSVFVNLQFVDDDLGWVNSNGNGDTVGLVTSKLLNVNDILATVNLDDLSVFSLVSSSGDCDFIILSDGDRSNMVFLSELCGQRSTHDDSSD